MSPRLPWILLGGVSVVSIAVISYLLGAGTIGDGAEATPAAVVGNATPTASPVPTGSVTPTRTATPAPSTPTPAPTPPPTATPTPAPTPVTVDLPRPSSGSGSKAGEHTGIFGIVFAAAGFGFNPGTGRMQAYAYTPTVGSGEHPMASAWLDRTFTVPAALGASVTAQASGDVSWSGTLAGTGVAGSGADVEVRLVLLEGTRVVARTVAPSKEVRESALSVGGQSDSGSASPALSATVVGGRQYTLRLEVECNATTGIAGAAVHCIYGPSDLYAEGYVDWKGFTVELIP